MAATAASWLRGQQVRVGDQQRVAGPRGGRHRRRSCVTRSTLHALVAQQLGRPRALPGGVARPRVERAALRRLSPTSRASSRPATQHQRTHDQRAACRAPQVAGASRSGEAVRR